MFLAMALNEGSDVMLMACNDLEKAKSICDTDAADSWPAKYGYAVYSLKVDEVPQVVVVRDPKGEWI